MKWGILFRWQSFWIGAHWSPYNRRLCVNLIPFITVWVTVRGGSTPNKGINIYRNDLLEQKQIEHKTKLLERHTERCEHAYDLDRTRGLSLDQINQLRLLVIYATAQDTPLDEFKWQADQLIESFKNADANAVFPTAPPKTRH